MVKGDFITSIRGEHCHDTNLVAKAVYIATERTIASAISNPLYIAPRVHLAGLTSELDLQFPSAFGALSALPK